MHLDFKHTYVATFVLYKINVHTLPDSLHMCIQVPHVGTYYNNLRVQKQANPHLATIRPS